MGRLRISVRELFKKFPELTQFVTMEIETLKDMSTDLEAFKSAKAVTLHDTAEPDEQELIERAFPEKLVQHALEKLMQGRTSIIIAHRLATVRKADQIFVLEKGRLIESGTHSELIKIPDGRYQTLSSLQYLE